ncbi:MAG: hypothetical protein ACRDGO_04515 [Actinomycetota bacterium]
MDRGQTLREPARQEDARDRTIVRTQRLGHVDERTMEPVRREDHALATYHGSGERGSPIGPFRETWIRQVDHARLDGEPRQRTDDFDRDERA